MRTRAGELEGFWTEAGGWSLFARARTDLAPAGAPPVVLVSGLGVSGRYLLPTARRLAPHHPVYVPDLPGVGRSALPPRALSVPELADALAAWLAAVGLSRPALLGNSLGCQVIVDLAARRPECVGRAVLVSPTMDPRAGALRQLLRTACDAFREPWSLIPLVTADYLRAGPLRAWRTLRLALADPMPDKLPRVAAPTLVVAGARDPIVPTDWAAEVAARVPGGRLVVLPRAAHAANFDAPDDLVRVVLAFLREAAPPTPPSGTATGHSAGRAAAAGVPL